MKKLTFETFIKPIKTVVIGTIDAHNNPFSSYAPYIYDSNRFYIYISNIATHSKNLQANRNVSLFFIEDESQSENLFARKRLVLQCTSTKIDRDTQRFEEVLVLFEKKFDAKTVLMLKQMHDFNLFEIEVEEGEATFGFADAYTVGGAHKNELIPRSGMGHSQK